MLSSLYVWLLQSPVHCSSASQTPAVVVSSQQLHTEPWINISDASVKIFIVPRIVILIAVTTYESEYMCGFAY